MIRLTVLCFLITTGSVAQDSQFLAGARSNGMAQASLNILDPWSLFNSTGSFGALEAGGIHLTYQDRYGLNDLQVIAGGISTHTRLFNLGAKYYRFGSDLYNQQLAGIVIGNKIQLVSLGLGLNIVQTAAEGQQTERIIIWEFGGRVELHPKLVFGAHLFNLKNTFNHPTVMKTGISFLPIEVISLNLQLQKQLRVPEQILLGMEYQPVKKVYLRTGISSQRTNLDQAIVKTAFGLGFHPKNFQFDYAFNSESNLGAIHECSVSFSFDGE